TRALLFRLQQESFAATAELLQQRGDTKGVLATGAQLHAALRRFGGVDADPLDIADPHAGHQALLLECRALADTGDRSQTATAFAQALRLADRHADDHVGRRARALVAELLADRAVALPSALLFEAARAEMRDRDQTAAIRDLQRALAAMTPAEFERLGLQAWDALGTAYALADRLLESVVAFRTGLQRCGRSGDPAGALMAEHAEQALAALRARDPDAFAGLATATAQSIAAFGGPASANRVHWQAAGAAMAAAQAATDPAPKAANYRRAAAEYGMVAADFPHYELARVRVATAQALGGDFAAAQQTIADYRSFLASAATALPADASDRRRVRAAAIVEADFREASMLYQTAIGSAPESKKDLTRYPAAISRLRTFLAEVGRDDEQFTGLALDLLGRLHADLQQMDQAEDCYQKLAPRDPQHLLAPALASVLFGVYLTQAHGFAAERDHARRSGREADLPAIEAELLRVRTRLVQLGSDYAAAAARPQIGMLANTLLAAAALGQWNRVWELADKTLELYGVDEQRLAAQFGRAQVAEIQRTVDFVVRPKAAEALLMLHRFQRAHDLLQAAIATLPANGELLRLLAMALGGWLEFDPRGGMALVPGLGHPDQAYDVYYGQYRAFALRPEVREYSLAWYRFHWEAYWYALRAAGLDSRYRSRAATLYHRARSTDDFASLQRLGIDGLELWRAFTQNPPPK
ncbi:MAG TPA: hypothetical protein VK348_05010, partial [Planctomycetota bacterium]|nr:hypothetical protein [Planctomycetota bacterium]